MTLLRRFKRVVSAHVEDFLVGLQEPTPLLDAFSFDTTVGYATPASDLPPVEDRRSSASAFPQEALKYYANLELPAGANSADIRRAYRRLIRRYHPDQFSQPAQREAAEAVVRQLNAAYAYFQANPPQPSHWLKESRHG
jgi:hypothetical protein